VAVVGTGLDRVYPPATRRWPNALPRRARWSANTPRHAALAENFPQRNRIIAGLSLGTLVVEAALQSGSLITARLALEAGREVFAIPGSIHAPQSKGCHALHQTRRQAGGNGAGHRRRTAPGRPAQAALAAGRTPADPLLQALGHDPVTSTR
jgi:DNA processing protein